MQCSSMLVTHARMLAGTAAGDKTGQYKGMLDCFVKSFRSGGIMTFYNGFLPNFARLGSWNCAMFLTVEQVRPRAHSIVHCICSIQASHTVAFIGEDGVCAVPIANAMRR